MLKSKALEVVHQYLAQFAATDDFESSIESIYGTRIGSAALRQQWLSGDFSLIPEVRVLSNGELATANGAYATDLDEILVSSDFLGRHQDDVLAVAGLLLEEFGHKLDRVLNGSVDSPGDEGAIFRSLVTGQSLSPEMLAGLRAQDDRSTILLDGNAVDVEKQDFFGDAGGVVTDDSISGTAGDDNISGLGGNDRLSGLDGNDTVNGGDGIDRLFGGNGNDILNGDAGNDDLNSDAGNDNINGGAGFDTYDANYSDRLSGLTMTFDSATGNGTIVVGTETDTLNSIENLSIIGTNFDDTIVGSATRDFVLRGGAGNDNISGNGGDDYLLGDDGNDTVNGGDDNDDLFGGNGNDTLNGDAGNDRLTSDAGNDNINGGAGFDTYDVNYSDRLSGLTMTFDSATGNGTIVVGTETDTLNSIENLSIIGTNFDDTIVGSATRDFVLRGGAGNDNISGNGGDDYLLGDDGNDTVNGGDDNDDLFGGNGNDTLNGDAGNDRLTSDAGNDNINGGAGFDTYDANYSDRLSGLTMTFDSATGNGTIVVGTETDTLNSIENLSIIGTNFDDTIVGSATRDFVLRGGAGNDNISGNGGDDYLLGDDGNDTVNGGDGYDDLFGGNGNDTLVGVNSINPNPGIGERDNLTGGAGSDRFILGDAANIYYDDRDIATNGSTNYATIKDFNSLEDKVQLKGVAANYRLEVSGTNTNLYIDKAGSEPDELIAVFENVTGLNLTSTAFEYIAPVTNATNTVSFGAATYNFSENATAQVTVLRSGDTTGQTNLSVFLTNGTATAPADYENTPISVSFNAGETSKTVTIPIVNDNIFEADETINLALTNLSSDTALGTQNTAILTIANDDPASPGLLAFSSPNFNVNEDGTTTAAVTVIRTGGQDGAVSATLNFQDGTAKAPNDYNNAPITVNFANGEVTKTVTIPIENDTLVEGNETVDLTLTNPTGGAILGTQISAVLTIIDNNVNPTAGVLSFANPTYSFNESGVPIATVTIDRTGGSNGAISTTILLNGGTATAGSDYNNNPITVNFANGETTKTVTIPIANDTQVEPTETINLTLSNPTGGATIDSTKNTAVVNILDDDTQLNFTNAEYTVNENGTVVSQITVTRSGRTTGAVSATLSFIDGTAKGCTCAASSVNNDFHNGTFVINFAEGETSKVIPVQLASLGGSNAIRIRDDARVEGDEYFSITLINATGGATIGSQGSAKVTIIDNDVLPKLTVSFNQSAFAENAGVGAATGTVTRDVVTDAPLVVSLTSSDITEATVPQQVTIAAGQSSATFSIDAVDDTILDGIQNVTITATPLNADTNTPLTAGATTGSLQVTDNESPILTLSVDREILAETGAATATITRNTDTSTELVVTLTSSDTTEATVPQTVTIPVGQTAVNFTVSGVNDGVSDGNQPVTITASANGFSSGVKTINVSDIEVPDLVITQLNGAVPTYTGKQATFNYRVENKGILPATAPDKPNTNPVEKDPWVDRVYLSTDNKLDTNDTLLGEFSFSGSVPVGSFYERNITYFAPRTPGQYYLIGVTDANSKVNEGIGENNNTVITPLTVTPAYKATVATDVTIANIGTKVILKGQATSTQDNSPTAFEFVKIKVENKGITRELDAFTDGNGNFVKEFQPLPGEAGTYNINAYFPANPAEDAAPEDTFKLLGMQFEQNDQLLPSVTQQVVQGKTFTGSVKLQNLSDDVLSGLTGSVIDAPSNWTVNITPEKTALAGNEEINVNYSITVPDNTIRNDQLQLRLTSAEGVAATLPVTVNVDPIVPKLVASTNTITSGMLRGNQTFVEVEVTNQGGDIAKNIKVTIPDASWLSLTSPTIIPALAPGETTKVTLRLNPDANLALTEYKGNILLDVEGNDGDLSLPFNFRAVSEAVGNIKIDVSDELTYFAEGAPKLTGAAVNLLDYFTKEVIATATSDETGVINFANIKEGAYELEVKADNHDTFKQTIQLDAGEFENVNAFLSRQTVKYIWNVTPTEIQDKYNISVESVFETNVPIPVVVVDPPLIDLDDLQVVGQVKQIDMTVTNQGLIAANNVRFDFGSHPFYKIEPLIKDIGLLTAKSSITVPVKITRIGDFDQPIEGSSSELKIQSTQPSVPCAIAACVISEYICGIIPVFKCTSVPVTGVEGNCDVGIFGGRGGGGDGSIGGISYTPVTVNYQDCDPCIENLKNAVLKCVEKFIPILDWQKCLQNEYKCVSDLFSIGLDWSTAYNCFKTVTSCAKAFGKTVPGPWKYLKYLECGYELITACANVSTGGGASASSLSLSSLSVLSLSEFPALESTNIPESAIQAIATNLKSLQDFVDAQTLIFGDFAWWEAAANDDVTFTNWLEAFDGRIEGLTTSSVKISDLERNELLQIALPQGITAVDVNKFLDRWNRSIDNWEAGIFNLKDLPAGQSQDFLALDVWKDALAKANAAIEASEAAGFTDVGEQFYSSVDELRKALDNGNSGGVCATVRLKIDQEAVMTRSAFLGELEIDNSNSTNLSNLSVNLQIKDETGKVVNELFGIDVPTLKNITAVDGTGILTGDDPNTPQDEGVGSAKWTFIPTNLAAPETPTQYTIGGTLAYIENGKAISVPLISTPITVNPQAELYLNYFHQRDVFGDDPFTDKIETSVPYNLGVLVENRGKGTAKNLSITSGQPKIIENEKGLLIDFNIIGSQVNNQSVTPSLGVNFGNIDAGQSGVATWLLKSSLQGKFIDYKATFEHVNSLGKKELSLIKDVQIHELIRQVKVNHTKPDDLADFLVNDVFDANFYPDTLYFSSGGTAPVKTITNATTDGNATSTDLEVNVTATVENGWSYIRLNDPGDGQYQVKKVLRADGTEVNIENVWTTDRTFPATGRPIYENILNLLDFNATAGDAKYTVLYSTGDNTGPKVRDIVDVDPNPRTTPVTSLEVVFTESIKGNTFDFNDITLTRDGGANLITSAVTVTQINPTTYRIDNLTGITGNVGQYQLSINASGVEDIEGLAGVGIVTENWLLNGDKPAVAKLEGIASNRRNAPVDSLTITFTEALNPTSFDIADITLTRNNGANLINAGVTITQIDPTTYQINGLTDLTKEDGNYQILIQASGVTDTDGNSGVGGKGFAWTMGASAPVVTDVVDLKVDPRNTSVSSLDVILSKPIDITTFTSDDITLTLNGGANLITNGVTVTAPFDSAQGSAGSTTYRINGLNNLTTAEGTYNLTVNGSGIKDTFGNAGTGTQSESWIMDTTAPTAITNLVVADATPAAAGQFRVNSTNPTISGELSETGLQVFFFNKTTGENLGQATVTGKTFTGTANLPTSGTQDLEIQVQDAAGNTTATPLNLFADTIKPAIAELIVPTSSSTPITSLDVRFSEAINLSTFTKTDLTLTRDGVALTLPDTVTIELVSGTTYRIKGLQGLTTSLGNYQLKVDATTIQDNAGNSGDAPKTATFSIVAPPTPGITFAQTNGTTSVTEGGTTDTYSLVLKTQPIADVTVNLAVGNGISLDKTTLTFTSTNWNTAQTVTVTAVDDTIPEGNQTANITHTVSSSDTNYNALTLPTISVSIADNDAEIRGLKWNDLDGDGVKDATESGLKDWKIYLDTNTNGKLDTGETSTLTDDNGNYIFSNLRPDTYTVAEELQPGWKQTYPGASVTTTGADIPLAIPTLELVSTSTTDAQLSFSTANYQVKEDGTAITEIVITRTGDTSSVVSATLNLTDGTAEGCGCAATSVNKDFNYTPINVTFAANEVRKVIPVESAVLGNPNAIRLRNDSKVEGEEYFTIQLTNPTVGAKIGETASAKVTIVDDESPASTTPTVQITSPSETTSTTTANPSNTKATDLINLDDFWADSRFSNIKGQGYSTVIIDTGADLNHPLFGADTDNNGIADRIIYQYDFADNDTDASDKNNHGSHIASIASAVAPGSNLIILKVFKDSGTGFFADLEKALQWVNQNASTYNIASVNLSVGDGQNWNTPISRYGIGDELAAIASQDILISAAAGNNFYTYNSQPGLAYPAIDPNTISVGAVWTDNFGSRTFSNGAKDNTTAPDTIASFSQRSSLLDVFAPGILITGANANGGTTTMGGTSQAAPYVTAIATLAQQIAQTNLGRKLTLAEFRNLLDTKSDLIIDGDNENDNVTNTGAKYDRINVLSLAEGILTLNKTGGATPTPNNPTNNGSNNPLQIPDTNLTQVHTVTLTSGQIAKDINFGNQKLNQLPTLTTISKSGNEDAKITFTSTDFTTAFSDTDGNSLTKIKISALPTNGTFQLNGAGVTIDQEIPLSELDKLVFTPDLNFSGNLNFTWNGFDGTDYATNPAQVNLTINPLPRISLSADITNAAEPGTPGKFVLTRSGITTQELTVNYALSTNATTPPELTANYILGGTAINGVDYQTLNGKVTFKAGENTAVVEIVPIDDNIYESNETVTLTLADGGAGYKLIPNSQSASLTITDNETKPTISITNITQSEGNSGTTNYAFNLTLSNPSVKTITVKYATADDTATSVSDYTTATGTVTFNPGETTKTVNVAVNGDDLYEADEPFKLNLTDAVNATIANSPATGTIVNDDLPIISIDLTDTDSAEPNNPGQFTLTRTGITTAELNVKYTIAGTATKEQDYTKLTGTVTFKAGEDKALIDINPIDDNIYEGNETVTLTLNEETTKYKLDPNKSAGTFTITDNETKPTISISDANPATGKESDPTAKNRVFTIALSNPSTETITIDYTTLDGTAVAGSDYTATQGTLTFKPGETTQTINATILDDAIFEDTETFKLQLTNPTNATLTTSDSTATIIDNDLPGIFLTVTDSEAAETKHGKPTNPGKFTLTRTGSTTNPLAVKYILEGNAINGKDYQELEHTITFAAGSDTASIDIDIIDDKIYEGTEKVILNLCDSNDYTIVGEKSGVISIADNDAKLPQIIQPTQNCLEIEGGTEKSLLKFTKMAHEAMNKSEICAFVVDDEQGRIGGIKPGEVGYLAAALDRSQVIFSNLGNNPTDREFDRDSQRYLNFTPGDRVHFALIADDTLDKVQADLTDGKPTANVLFSLPEANAGNAQSKFTTLANNGGYEIAWEDNLNDGKTTPDFNDLVLKVETLDNFTPPVGTGLQGNSEGEVIDLRGLAGQTMKVDIRSVSDAAYNNYIGFYEVEDTQGTLINGLKPGDLGYAQAAIQSAILQTFKTETKSDLTASGGKILAPVIIANGTFADYLKTNPQNQASSNIHAYFNYLGANTDKVDHFRLLGDNKFGVEDMYGGGDRDYNDIVFQMNIKS